MSLASQITLLAQRLATEVNTLRGEIASSGGGGGTSLPVPTSLGVSNQATTNATQYFSFYASGTPGDIYLCGITNALFKGSDYGSAYEKVYARALRSGQWYYVYPIGSWVTGSTTVTVTANGYAETFVVVMSSGGGAAP